MLTRPHQPTLHFSPAPQPQPAIKGVNTNILIADPSGWEEAVAMANNIKSQSATGVDGTMDFTARVSVYHMDDRRAVDVARLWRRLKLSTARRSA